MSVRRRWLAENVIVQFSRTAQIFFLRQFSEGIRTCKIQTLGQKRIRNIALSTKELGPSSVHCADSGAGRKLKKSQTQAWFTFTIYNFTFCSRFRYCEDTQHGNLLQSLLMTSRVTYFIQHWRETAWAQTNAAKKAGKWCGQNVRWMDREGKN